MLKIEAEKSGLPLGKGGRINRLINENWQEHLVELTPVKNTVLWINPAFSHLPFDLQVGKPTSLGIFATLSSTGGAINTKQNKLVGECWEKHGRSVLLSRVLIEDNLGNPYREIDIKGIGNIDFHDVSVGSMRKRVVDVLNPGRTIKKDDYNWEGLLHEGIARYDAETGEKLFSTGVRIVRPLVIIKLNEIVYGGEEISIEEAKNKKLIDEAIDPVLEMRAFGTRARIGDLSNVQKPNNSKLLLEDAISLVSDGLRREKTMFKEDYFEWFGRTLGKNIGLLHKNNLCHNYLTPHNITLDCRLVDFDSVDGVRRDHISEDKDKDNIDNTLYLFISNLFNSEVVSYEESYRYKNILNENFHKEYNSCLG